MVGRGGRVSQGGGIGGLYQYLVHSADGGQNTSILLGDELADYARRKVETGEFSSTSEIVRDARIERLRQLVREGEESGPARPFNLARFIGERFPDA
jgi:antitoxin ParD1/3/4